MPEAQLPCVDQWLVAMPGLLPAQKQGEIRANRLSKGSGFDGLRSG
jgi:hypothetical protein